MPMPIISKDGVLNYYDSEYKSIYKRNIADGSMHVLTRHALMPYTKRRTYWVCVLDNEGRYKDTQPIINGTDFQSLDEAKNAVDSYDPKKDAHVSVGVAEPSYADFYVPW